MIRVGIVGGTGYTGSELLRILARHPQVSLAAITSAVRPVRPWLTFSHTCAGRLISSSASPMWAFWANAIWSSSRLPTARR